MTVNGIDVSTFKAKLLNKDIQSADVTIYDDWLRQSLSPLYYGKKEQYKAIKLQFVVEDSTDDACLTDIGNLLLQLEKGTLKFDDSTFYYDATITNKDNSSLVQNGSYVLTNSNDKAYLQNVDLRAPCAYLPTVTVTLVGTSQSITIQGNLLAPAVVTLTPTVNLGSAIASGFGKDMTIKNFVANTPVIIDGEQGLVTQSGANKFGDTDMWAFPTLKPGANTISINQTGVAVKIQYKPRFM